MNRIAIYIKVRVRQYLHDDRNKRFFFVYQAITTTIRDWSHALVYKFSLSLHLPWPAAYLWKAGNLINNLSSLIESDKYDSHSAERLRQEALMILDYVERIATKSPDCLQLRCRLALMTGRTNEFLKLQVQVFESQEAQTELAGTLNHNLRVLEPHFHILVGIGSTVHLDAYVKAGLLGMRPPSRTVVLHESWLRRYAVNPCLLDYWRPFIDIVEDEDQLRTLRPLKKHLAFNVTGPMRCGSTIIPWGHSAAVFLQREWDRQSRKPLLQLSDEHRERGLAALQTLGVPRTAWITTLHVREGKFGAHRHSEPFRDADINTYLAAIEAITDRGGWVIRMGDSSMTPLPKMRNVIDYANDPIKSDWMDVFLCASARFMIGTSSGPSTISRAFGVPIAMTNHLQASTNYLGAHDLFLPRLLRRRANGILASFEQQMSLPFSACFSDGMYRNLCGLDVIPNTAVEIRELIEEIMDSLDGTLQYSPEDQKLQHRFNSLTAECGTLLGLPGIGLQCRIGRDFLMRHQNLLADNFKNHDQPNLER